MKKFGKFVLGSITLATVAAGAYYLYKNFINKDYSDDFDDFDDEFDEEIEDELDDEEVNTEDIEDDKEGSREYVSIQINSENIKAEPDNVAAANVEEDPSELDLAEDVTTENDSTDKEE